jgi:hypothetical protein
MRRLVCFDWLIKEWSKEGIWFDASKALRPRLRGFCCMGCAIELLKLDNDYLRSSALISLIAKPI